MKSWLTSSVEDWESFSSRDDMGCTEHNVVALSPGSCRIICTAENVSAQCICTIKPYLEDLVFDFTLDENGNIVMQPLQELVVHAERIPNDCIDGEITISSSIVML